MKITIELKNEEVEAYKSYLKTRHRVGEKCPDKITKKIIQDEIRKFIYSQLFVLSPVYYYFPEDYPIFRPGDKRTKERKNKKL